jgi:hypothetical protein
MIDVPGSQETFKMLAGFTSNEKDIPIAGSKVEEVLEQRMHVALHPSDVGRMIKGIQCYADPHVLEYLPLKIDKVDPLALQEPSIVIEYLWTDALTVGTLTDELPVELSSSTPQLIVCQRAPKCGRDPVRIERWRQQPVATILDPFLNGIYG